MEKNTKFNIAGVIAGIISIIFGGSLWFIENHRMKVYDNFSENYETISDEEFEQTLKLLVKWKFINDPETYRMLRNHNRNMEKIEKEFLETDDEAKKVIEQCKETLARFEKMQAEED